MAHLSLLQGSRHLPVDSVRAVLPRGGSWIAWVRCPETAELDGPATVTIGDIQLEGKVNPRRSANHRTRANLFVVGGLGWQAWLKARHWHNDAGELARTILETTAGEAGEPIDTSGVAGKRVGADWVRSQGPASRTLGLLAPDWYVDPSGTAQTAARPARELPDDAGAELLGYETDSRTAVMKTITPAALLPGVVLRRGLEVPLRVTSLDLVVAEGSFLARASGEHHV